MWWRWTQSGHDVSAEAIEVPGAKEENPLYTRYRAPLSPRRGEWS